MHHFKAKGGTSVNFNGDLSGDAHVSVGPNRAQYGHALIPCADLIEIVDYWRRLGVSSDAKGRLELEPAAVQTRADADRFRGIVDYDFLIKGERDEWYPWATLKYLVVDVLVPSGSRIDAEDERLYGLSWWPRRPVDNAQPHGQNP